MSTKRPTALDVVAAALLFGVVTGCSFQPGHVPGSDDGSVDAPPDAVDPTKDTDGDGVLDLADNCIAITNADQRNFDADAVGDACDPCPHLMNMNADGDGDGVGDACDPQPTVAAETRVLWTSFHEAAEITGWNHYGEFAVSGGKLVHPNGAEPHPSIAPNTQFQKAYAAAGIHLTTNASGSSGVGLCTDTTGGSLYYCCEVREGGTPQVVALSNYSSGGGSSGVNWTGTFAADSRFQLEVNVLGANKCTARQSTMAVTTSSGSDGPHDGLVFVYLDYAVAEVEYLFVVETM